MGGSSSSAHHHSHGHGNGIGIAGTPSEHSLTRETALERELMAIRLQEAKTTALAKDQKMKILELEQWCEHLSKQMTRTEDERADLRFRIQEMEKEKINLENLGQFAKSSGTSNKTPVSRTGSSSNEKSSEKNEKEDKEQENSQKEVEDKDKDQSVTLTETSI